jgi:steroid delta-isomerase
MPLPGTIQQVVEDYFAAIRAMDPEAWLNTFAENAVSNDPVGGVPIEGHKGLRQFFQDVGGAFETLGITEDHVFVAGNQAAVKWTGRGVGKNGAEVTFEGIDVFEVNDQGKIQTLWGYWNPNALMAELLA